MTEYLISKTFPWRGTITEKTSAVMRMFGLSYEKLSSEAVCHTCRVNINCGDIVYITGPSGAGKSVLLRELAKQIPNDQKVNLDDIELPGDKALVDCIEGDFLQSLKTLSIAGLNDVRCILNRPANLSDGQKYRFKLAMAIATGRKFIFGDEFCSNLDRITAAVISHNVRKFADRHKVTFILASSHDDILVDLLPEIIVSKDLSGPAEVVYKEV